MNLLIFIRQELMRSLHPKTTFQWEENPLWPLVHYSPLIPTSDFFSYLDFLKFTFQKLCPGRLKLKDLLQPVKLMKEWALSIPSSPEALCALNSLSVHQAPGQTFSQTLAPAVSEWVPQFPRTLRCHSTERPLY